MLGTPLVCQLQLSCASYSQLLVATTLSFDLPPLHWFQGALRGNEYMKVCMSSPFVCRACELPFLTCTRTCVDRRTCTPTSYHVATSIFKRKYASCSQSFIRAELTSCCVCVRMCTLGRGKCGHGLRTRERQHATYFVHLPYTNTRVSLIL